MGALPGRGRRQPLTANVGEVHARLLEQLAPGEYARLPAAAAGTLPAVLLESSGAVLRLERRANVRLQSAQIVLDRPWIGITARFGFPGHVRLALKVLATKRSRSAAAPRLGGPHDVTADGFCDLCRPQAAGPPRDDVVDRGTELSLHLA